MHQEKLKGIVTALVTPLTAAGELDEEGHLTVPSASGLGVKFSKEAAKLHPPEITEPPHWKREDGGFHELLDDQSPVEAKTS